MAKNRIALLIVGMMVALTGCNTMRGVGQDLERGGEAIQKAATK